jgi:cytochrome-b5 reductase
VKVELDGRSIIRAYTPTSPPNVCGYFDLMIKTYEFGQMSKYLGECAFSAARAVPPGMGY